MQPQNADALTTELLVYHFAIVLVVMVVGCAAAWALVRWIAWSYRSQRASDQMLAVDVLMVIFTWAGFVALSPYGWNAAWVLAGFAGYKVIFTLRSRRRSRSPPGPFCCCGCSDSPGVRSGCSMTWGSAGATSDRSN